MGCAEVLQQDMPLIGFRIPIGIETPWNETSWHASSHLGIKRNLGVAAPMPAITKGALEQQRRRCPGDGTVVSQFQSHDTRQDRIAWIFFFDSP
jgi:hypothetical protein